MVVIVMIVGVRVLLVEELSIKANLMIFISVEVSIAIQAIRYLNAPTVGASKGITSQRTRVTCCLTAGDAEARQQEQCCQDSIHTNVCC